MKRNILILALLVLSVPASFAQRYKMVFRLEDNTDTIMYIASHYRDHLTRLDSAHRATDGSFTFAGNRTWPRGVYALVGQKGDKSLRDFVIDDSRRFTISGDATLTPSSVTVKGSDANRDMFLYQATVDQARREMESIRARKKDAATRTQAETDEQALTARMEEFEKRMRNPQKEQLYFTLLALCDNGEVPDSVDDKPLYYRQHYWDTFFRTPLAASHLTLSTLLHSPQFFNKVNYFFFGMLYYADSDTISAEIDRLAARIGDDTAMLRYVFDHIEPRYFRSTRNVGWDAAWCHLAEHYYLAGRCPWASEGTLHNMRYNYNRIRKSIIGAHGQELWMSDTNQSADPKDWISSHRFPTPYVILWFWDPDCHHCQKQSEELKVLYDSLLTAPYRPFEVYAVGYESDVDKWKKYVKEHDFRWVNVGGPNVNVDYQEAYNVHGAPTMIILDQNRDIIMNKVLSIKNLMKFLEDHEKKRQQ